MRYWRKNRRIIFVLILLAVASIGVVVGSRLFAQTERPLPNVLSSMGVEDAYTRFLETVASEATIEPEAAVEPFKVWIDAGHGGVDTGAEGHSGSSESVINLEIATKLYEFLLSDTRFEPRMTRADDTFVELEERVEMANTWQADVFVSIHGNAYEQSSVAGIETFYKHDNGLPLAEAVHGNLVKAMGFKDRGIRQKYLQVLALSHMPAVLIESGYLTNEAEEAVLLSEEGQVRLAEAILDGIRQYAANTVPEQGDPVSDLTETDAPELDENDPGSILLN